MSWACFSYTQIRCRYVGQPTKESKVAHMSSSRHMDLHGSPFGCVVMVASLGGMDAFTSVIAGLPADFSVPIVVVQHRPGLAGPGDPLASVLGRRTGLQVRVAQHGTEAHQEGITVVPGATSATVDSTGRWCLSPIRKEVNAGDEVLASFAGVAPTIAVIMTGYQSDGSQGCRAVKMGGGRVLVQDPGTARAPAMPSNAIATGCADFVLPLDRLATAVLALTSGPGAADFLTVPLPPWARLTS